jgi:curved DNA-binding protein
MVDYLTFEKIRFFLRKTYDSDNKKQEYGMEFKDYYAVLGVTPQTPEDEIKREYRKLARKYHPDVSKLPDAEQKFKEVNEAWEVLQDKEKRAQYDQIRAGGWNPNQHAHQAGARQRHYAHHTSPEQTADFSDFFRSIFGGMDGFEEDIAYPQSRARKGQDIHAKLQIPLSLAFTGGTQSLTLQTGSAQKQLNVKIPAGVKKGSQIRLKEQGQTGLGGVAGDLYVEIDIAPHPFFTLVNKDIHLNLPITPWEGALGASLTVPTLGGNVNLKIPANAQSGQQLRLKGRGLPGEPAGDQYVILQIQIPRADTDKAKELYQQMAQELPFNPRKALGV